MRLKSLYVVFITIISLAIVGAVDAKPPTGLKNLLGTWHSAQPTSGGVVKIVVTSTGSQLQVRAYGRCTPTPCDWANPIAAFVGCPFASKAAFREGPKTSRVLSSCI